MSHLRPTAVKPAGSVSLIEAKPIPRNQPVSRPAEFGHPLPQVVTAPTSSQAAPARKPLTEIERPAAEPSVRPIENHLAAKEHFTNGADQANRLGIRNMSSVAQAANSVDEENLPPIVPSWAVPRPGTKKRAPAGSRTEFIQSASIQNSLRQPAPSAGMRIELGNPEPRSPATIVLPPNSQAADTPQAKLRPINNAASGQVPPAKTPSSKDDEKPSDGQRQQTKAPNPFLKPVSYLTDPVLPARDAAGAGAQYPLINERAVSPFRLPPIAPPRTEEPAPPPPEPRLLPMPLEISNPYASGK